MTTGKPRFRPIAGYENYSISDSGILKKGDKILKTAPNKFGVLKAGLSKNNVRIRRSVHILVLEAFVGLRPKNKEGCHRDDDKNNNSFENLYWGTREENLRDRAANGKNVCGERLHLSKLTEKQVLEIRQRYVRPKRHESNASLLGKEFGVTKSSIVNVVRRKTWKHL